MTSIQSLQALLNQGQGNFSFKLQDPKLDPSTKVPFKTVVSQTLKLLASKPLGQKILISKEQEAQQKSKE